MIVMELNLLEIAVSHSETANSDITFQTQPYYHLVMPDQLDISVSVTRPRHDLCLLWWYSYCDQEAPSTTNNQERRHCT
jgi:hypothetical protein